MRRPLVGRRAGVGHIARPDHLRLRACQAIGQFGDLARELENHPVLLLHMALQKGKALFDFMQARIHSPRVRSDKAGASPATDVFYG